MIEPTLPTEAVALDSRPLVFRTPVADRADGFVTRTPGERRIYVAYLTAMVILGPSPAAWLARHGLVTALDVGLFVSFYAATTIAWALGWHRMLAHRAFDLHPVAKTAVLAIAAMSGQGGPASFVLAHRAHHAHADQPGDPHSPRDGFWHAHAGWFVDGEPSGREHARILRDPVVAFFDRHWIVFPFAGWLLPALLGGLLGGHGHFDPWTALTALVWGGTCRYVLASHALWLGGSLAHTFGHRTFNTPDDSRNSVILSLLTFGDGWHNNHHASPGAANLDARWWQIDGPALVLRLLDKVGLVERARWYGRLDWDRREAHLARRAAREHATQDAPAREVPGGRETAGEPVLPARAHAPKTRGQAIRGRRDFLDRLAIAFVLLLPIGGLALAWHRGLRVTALDVALFTGFHLFAYVGMTLGYHRMLCHRVFVPHPIVKAFLLLGGGTAIMAGPSEFVAQHLAHHAHSDTERDPHTASLGFFHAHMGWIVAPDKVEVWPPARLARDAMVSFFDRMHAVVGVVGLLLPALIGGVAGAALYEGRLGFSPDHALGGLVWGGLLRLGIGQHLVFASASVNHTFGKRAFPTADGSRNSPLWLNVIQLGEGFHNHHHALPWAASFAVRPGQIDVGALLIRALEALGLARNARWPSEADWDRARSRTRGQPLD